MRGRWIGLGGLAFLACTRTPEEADPAPFPEDTNDDAPVLPSTSTTTFPLDTGFTAASDAAPDEILLVRQRGSWTLSGSPYSSLAGFATLTELLAGEPEPSDTAPPLDTAAPLEPPNCRFDVAMTGVLPDEPSGCPCDFVFDVEFFVSEGDPAACQSPDLPGDGEVWRMGFSAADEVIYLNYRGSGVYVPWWPAEKVGDVVTFDWTIDLGVEVEEEE